MFIERNISDSVRQNLEWYPIIYLGGPRQSGKTTLLQHLFPDLPYTSLEDPDTRLLAEEDPRRFLSRFPEGGILDEAQRVPVLFSYLQGIVDADKSKRFLLSGSQNFLLMEKITQSLAGRVGLLNLLPLSLAELRDLAAPKMEEYVWKGGYPALFEREIPPDVFFGNYLQTYLERDVRLLKNVGDLSQFARFMRLCAGRVGQPMNMSTLATDTGVSVTTVKAWLSVLEASYMVFFLSPFHKNFNKRIIKAPKMYFFDTGLLCHLLGIAAAGQLETHHYFGNIFENAVIAELYKKRTNSGKRPTFWFWQDQHHNEVDLLIEEDGQLTAVEIKASQTYNSRLISSLKKWQKMTGSAGEAQVLVYAGEQEMELESCRLLPWRRAFETL